MSGQRSHALIVSIVAVLFITAVSTGCSRKKDDGASSRVQEVQKAVADLEREQASPTQEADACKMHKYFINPGETANITFEILLNTTTAKAVESEEPTFHKRELDAMGYSASLTRSLDSFSRSAPIWFVSHPIFGKRDDAPTAKGIAMGSLFIKGNGAGEGIIVAVGKIKSAAAVGQLSRDELTKMMNGKSTIVLIDADLKRYEVTPEQKSMDTEFNMLVAEVKLDVPQVVEGHQKIADASIIWPTAKVHIGFRVSYDKSQGKYVVTGPAFSRDCIK